MITIKEDTTLVGVSEMRTNMEGILAASRKHKVIIEKRHKPYAVLVGADQYTKMENRLEMLEDFALAHLAKSRDKKSKSSDYIAIETALANL
ncbi:MAG: type II toxin-antitoxin system prevent-host-death family antitoxin [Candidatus Omnitrophica bacterium]|nr:type II toxin-antitoxin system prevent-host-death family antitoxin [Candidatus Omnitrophota bacterium]